MMSYILLVGAVFLALLSWWYILYFKYMRYLTKYKGPTPLPFTGNLHRFRSNDDVIPVFMEFIKHYGPVVKLWFGYQPRIMIADHRTAEKLLGSTVIIDKSYDYHFFESWLGTGLLTSSGSKWRRQRKLLTPAFHFTILEQFTDTFHAQSDILVEKLQEMVGKGSFDIFPYINYCALDVICEATMGTQVNAQLDADSSYVQSVKEMCRILLDRSLSPIKMFDYLFSFSRDYWKEKKAISILHGYSNSVIRARKQALKMTSVSTTENSDNVGIRKRLAFLDLLLQCEVDGAPLSIEEIREQVDTFMFEGHDTTTSGITFTLYCLSVNPRVQAMAAKELITICGNDKQIPVTYQNLQDMKYLEMVIKESMRLYPPVPNFARQLFKDTEFDGTVLPEGTTFVVFPYGLHRQEEIYPEPEKFDPERFSAENSRKRSLYSYVPFSAGPRNCIGQRFVMLEMKSIISKILRRFELLPVPEHRLRLSVEAILKSTNGILIRLKERKY